MDFPFDRTLEPSEVCNFTEEIAILNRAVRQGDTIKILGLRNFGKTSVIRNVVGSGWQAEAPRRLMIYADLYSVMTLEDISAELNRAFNEAMARGLSTLKKAWKILEGLSKLRPVWIPPNNGDGIGEFSLRVEDGKQGLDFASILQNMDEIQLSGAFTFLLILDEFQEIAKIPKAEAKLRGALQDLRAPIPVVILGSKPHLLQDIFNKPRAPFYQWGNTIEFHPIAFPIYHRYMLERFESAGKTMDLETSQWLQESLHRIPEAINRFCQYLLSIPTKELSQRVVGDELKRFIDRSSSLLADRFARLSANERIIAIAIAQSSRVINPTGKDFLALCPGVAKSSVSNIVARFLDDAMIYRLVDPKTDVCGYTIADPFFAMYLRARVVH